MEEIIKIKGNKELNGTVYIEGAKNSLVALIPASIITKKIIKLNNVKPIEDTYTLLKILDKLNVKTIYDDKSELIIDARNVRNEELISEEIKSMRASYYFMGVLLSLFNNVTIASPGGCSFCDRPIDLHLSAFGQLGYSYKENSNVYTFNKIKENNREIIFSKKSVGATINAILACSRIEEDITIVNCAQEPEIDDLINFLNLTGVTIKRKKENILIRGTNEFKSCEYTIMSDRIEAGTFMILGALLSKELIIKNVNNNHLKEVIYTLKRIGVNIIEKDNELIVSKANKYLPLYLEIDSYPAFPTDLQQPMCVLLSRCKGISYIRDKVYPNRRSHIEELNKMNAKIEYNKEIIIINGERKFQANKIEGKDLRGGISLIIATLLSEGMSTIKGYQYIKRGYSNLIGKLKDLGANISLEVIDE